MPGFETHLRHGTRWASLVAVLTLAPASLSAMWIPHVALLGTLAFFSGLVGAVVPDIDSHSSVPRRRFEQVLSAFLVIGLAFGLWLSWDRLVTWSEQFARLSSNRSMVLVVLGVVAAILIVYLVPTFVHKILPAHRDAIHTVRFWMLVSGGLTVGVALLWSQFTTSATLAVSVGLAVGAPLLGGVCVHLRLDGELTVGRKRR